MLQVARQLLAANPKQQQLYTIQLDFTRTIYASGEWFVDHPECLLRDANDSLVSMTACARLFSLGCASHTEWPCSAR